METQLDHTYLRPGLIARAAAVGLAAVGVGAGVLLACWGLSFFWRYDDPVVRKLEALTQELATLNQKTTLETETLSQKMSQGLDALNQKINTLDQKVALVKIGTSGSAGGGRETYPGDVIKREVTVFSHVKHEPGQVVTRWVYKDGASDGFPKSQSCYYDTDNFDRSSTIIELAKDGKRVLNTGPVPRIDEALSKCQWWSAS